MFSILFRKGAPFHGVATRRWLPIVLLCCLSAGSVRAQMFPFQDSRLPLEERVEDLLSRLTLEEKLSLMEHRQPAITSLGLPAYSWWNEALHGVGRNGRATVWPMPIALAASWNTEMVYDIFSEVAVEACEKYAQARNSDTSAALREPTDYTGLTFFTPNINILRDPRWGRGMETYGEDPCLTAMMGAQCVNGLQHPFFYSTLTPQDSDTFNGIGMRQSHPQFSLLNSPLKEWLQAQPGGPLATAACVKHLAVHSGPEGVRHEFDATVSPRDLWTTYLPAFEYIVTHTDVQQVMCGYNRLNGVPCCTNRDLLMNILRNKWGYDGLVVTDCWALNDCWERDSVTPRHETHASAAAAAADAFGSEVDLECGSGLAALQEAVAQGFVNEERINDHVRRILRTRMRIEMEDDREVPPCHYNPTEAAAESLVLLKNSGLLPLKEGTRIYLAGPNATDTLMPLGNYNGEPRHTISIQEGLGHYFTLVERPQKAEVIVYAGGLTPQLEGEELQVEAEGFHRGDRTMIELPAAQRKELRKLSHKHKPMVLLLSSGSSIALKHKDMKCKAIMACWYGGEAMGEAVGASMAGLYDCFGRLPVTFYRSTEQLPDFESYDMQGRTYRYLADEQHSLSAAQEDDMEPHSSKAASSQTPLFPFGYGLNYDTHKLTNVRYDAASKRVTGEVRSLHKVADDEARQSAKATSSKAVMEVNLQSAKATSSKAVVEVYLKRPDDIEGPHISLVGFCKVPVAYGGVSSFTIALDDFWFRLFDEETQELRAPAADEPYEIWVGFDSETATRIF